jgi:short-subunit dehydrogenase
MASIKGKVVWITGASSGIGEALAYEMARKGAKLILSARRKDELERVKGNCIVSAQPDVRTLALDLAKPEMLKLSTEAALQIFGHVDILINNGGISQRSFAKDTSIDVDRRIMEVNYFGAIALTKHLLPHFLQRKSGHIVAVSSVTGKFGTPWRSGYTASKHALHGFFDSLRAELWKEVKNNIPVTIICPGFVNTPLTLSAVTGDGTPLGKSDDANFHGMDATLFVNKMIKAIEAKKNEVYIGGREVWGVYLKRFFPDLFARIIRKTAVR